MKIGDPPKTLPPSRTGDQKPAAASKAASAPSPVDEIVLMGLAANELSPRAREKMVALLTEVQELRAELKEARDRLRDMEEIADRDPLLNIYNRRAFVRELDRVLAMIDRYDVRASLVFIDLNDLKIINDKHGHAAGDAALEHVATLLAQNVRQTDVVGRLGGDEFGVLLLQSGQAQSEKKAEELAALVSGATIDWKGEALPAAVSWGAVEIRKGHTARQVMEEADSAMYASKKKK